MQPDTRLPKTPAIKIYTANITQAGTGAPQATVLQNTLEGEIVWTRTNTGEYTGTLIGAFTANKTAVILSQNAGLAQAASYDENTITIETFTPDYTPSDDIIANTTIEIRVYN